MEINSINKSQQKYEENPLKNVNKPITIVSMLINDLLCFVSETMRLETGGTSEQWCGVFQSPQTLLLCCVLA